MTSEAGAEAIRLALRHARWRWTGAPLLVTGAVLLLWAVGTAFRGGSGFSVLLSIFGTGMALASFGANHDTAMAMAVRARESSAAEGAAALPDDLRRELAAELDRDLAGTMGLRPAPRVALALPFVAAAVQAWVVFRLTG